MISYNNPARWSLEKLSHVISLQHLQKKYKRELFRLVWKGRYLTFRSFLSASMRS